MQTFGVTDLTPDNVPYQQNSENAHPCIERHQYILCMWWSYRKERRNKSYSVKFGIGWDHPYRSIL